MTDQAPPRVARFLLRLLPLGERRPDIEDDLMELFDARAARRGARYARRRYFGDVLSLWRRRRRDGPRLRQHLVRDSLRPVLCGLAVGVLGAALGSRVLAGVLYGISPADPLAFAGALMVLLAAATVAVFLPPDARRRSIRQRCYGTSNHSGGLRPPEPPTRPWRA